MFGWLFKKQTKQSGVLKFRDASKAVAHLRTQGLKSMYLCSLELAYELANDVWKHRDPYMCSDQETLLAILSCFIEKELLAEGGCIYIQHSSSNLDVQSISPETGMLLVYRVWAVEGGEFIVKASHEPISMPKPSLGPYDSLFEILRNPWNTNNNRRYEFEGAKLGLAKGWRQTMPLLILSLEAEADSLVACSAFVETLAQILKYQPESYSQFIEELAKLDSDAAIQVLDRVLFTPGNSLDMNSIDERVLQRCALSSKTCQIALELIQGKGTYMASRFIPIVAKVMLSKDLSKELREIAVEVMQDKGMELYGNEPLSYEETVAWWKKEGSHKKWQN